MELIDTHCHLDCIEGSLDEALQRANDNGVTKFISIGAASGRETNAAAIGLADKYDSVWATIGYHPHNAVDFSDLSSLEEYFEHPKVVAIGETGLDFYRDWAPKENQKRLLRYSIGVARELKKPLILHTREAREETFKILREEHADLIGGVFHCFSEDLEFAKRIIDFGFHISFTGIVTFKKAEGLQAVAQSIPLDTILLETDCPYMAPEPFRGKPSEPMHVYYIGKKIAELRNLDLETFAAAIKNNTKKLFTI